MARFDPSTWKARASARLRRDVDAGDAGALARFTLENDSIDSLQRVVSWCEARKLEVVFDRKSGGLYDSDARRIRIAGRALPDKQLYMLLHECGHHLIGDPRGDSRFSQGYSAVNEDPHVTRSATHRVAVVAEELEAWHRGRRLASRLKIRLNKQAFDEEQASCMKTYMKWCLRIDGYYLVKDGDDADKTNE